MRRITKFRFPLPVNGPVLFMLVGLYHSVSLTSAPYAPPKYAPYFLTLFKFRERHWGIPVLELTEPDVLPAFERRVREFSRLLMYLGGQYDSAEFIPGDRPRRPALIFQRGEIDLQYELSARRALNKKMLDQIRTLVGDFERQGVRVILLPLPQHAGFEWAEGLAPVPGSIPLGEMWVEKYERGNLAPSAVFRSLLNQLPGAVDLFTAFSRYRRAHPEADLFIPMDSHWSSLGISLAAAAILERLQHDGHPIPDAGPEYRYLEPPRYDYYLTGRLGLPENFLRGRPEFQWHQPIYALRRVPPDRPKGHLIPRGGRLIICGTSFTGTRATLGESLGDLLRDQLTSEVLVFPVNGGRTYGALNVLKQNQFRFRSGDVLVWEFSHNHLTLRSDGYPHFLVDPPYVRED